eukprot:EG_transcript_2201
MAVTLSLKAAVSIGQSTHWSAQDSPIKHFRTFFVPLYGVRQHAGNPASAADVVGPFLQRLLFSWQRILLQLRRRLWARQVLARFLCLAALARRKRLLVAMAAWASVEQEAGVAAILEWTEPSPPKRGSKPPGRKVVPSALKARVLASLHRTTVRGILLSCRTSIRHKPELNADLRRVSHTIAALWLRGRHRSLEVQQLVARLLGLRQRMGTYTSICAPCLDAEWASLGLADWESRLEELTCHTAEWRAGFFVDLGRLEAFHARRLAHFDDRLVIHEEKGGAADGLAGRRKMAEGLKTVTEIGGVASFLARVHRPVVPADRGPGDSEPASPGAAGARHPAGFPGPAVPDAVPRPAECGVSDREQMVGPSPPPSHPGGLGCPEGPTPARSPHRSPRTPPAASPKMSLPTPAPESNGVCVSILMASSADSQGQPPPDCVGPIAAPAAPSAMETPPLTWTPKTDASSKLAQLINLSAGLRCPRPQSPGSPTRSPQASPVKRSDGVAARSPPASPALRPKDATRLSPPTSPGGSQPSARPSSPSPSPRPSSPPSLQRTNSIPRGTAADGGSPKGSGRPPSSPLRRARSLRCRTVVLWKGQDGPAPPAPASGASSRSSSVSSAAGASPTAAAPSPPPGRPDRPLDETPAEPAEFHWWNSFGAEPLELQPLSVDRPSEAPLAGGVVPSPPDPLPLSQPLDLSAASPRQYTPHRLSASKHSPPSSPSSGASRLKTRLSNNLTLSFGHGEGSPALSPRSRGVRSPSGRPPHTPPSADGLRVSPADAAAEVATLPPQMSPFYPGRIRPAFRR